MAPRMGRQCYEGPWSILYTKALYRAKKRSVEDVAILEPQQLSKKTRTIADGPVPDAFQALGAYLPQY
jgi:hypothetical protein